MSKVTNLFDLLPLYITYSASFKYMWFNLNLSHFFLGVQIATLTGHTYRVLYLAVSPDGQTIVTGAGDETLRFWNVFPSPKSQVKLCALNDLKKCYFG